ncbi:MAG: hypothetical protein K8T25_02560 [Planctomycetia bacterium]|nr:hypothetical protein [Planctomycetia bacterium]
MNRHLVLLGLVATSLLLLEACCGAPAALADDTAVSLADGKLSLTAPAGWTKKEPKFAGIVMFEFAAPAAEGDQTDGRVTVGPAGGGIEANQQRWLGQFVQPDGSKTEDHAVRQEKKVAGCTVHLLDISGTYMAPRFAPGGGGKLPDQRLRVAVIDAGERGIYYIRLSGPQKTVAKHAADFDKMIDGLTAK